MATIPASKNKVPAEAKKPDENDNRNDYRNDYRHDLEISNIAEETAQVPLPADVSRTTGRKQPSSTPKTNHKKTKVSGAKRNRKQEKKNPPTKKAVPSKDAQTSVRKKESSQPRRTNPTRTTKLQKKIYTDTEETTPLSPVSNSPGDRHSCLSVQSLNFGS